VTRALRGSWFLYAALFFHAWLNVGAASALRLWLGVFLMCALCETTELARCGGSTPVCPAASPAPEPCARARGRRTVVFGGFEHLSDRWGPHVSGVPLIVFVTCVLACGRAGGPGQRACMRDCVLTLSCARQILA
jgi:hypothetical protein